MRYSLKSANDTATLATANFCAYPEKHTHTVTFSLSILGIQDRQEKDTSKILAAVGAIVMGKVRFDYAIISLGFGPYLFSPALLSITIKTSSQIAPANGIKTIKNIQPLFPTS